MSQHPDDVPAQQQQWPGSDADLTPPADHGAESWIGRDRLRGKRAVVTGGDSGIGRAVAIAFAREGAEVLIAHLPEEEADARATVRAGGRRGPGGASRSRPAHAAGQPRAGRAGGG